MKLRTLPVVASTLAALALAGCNVSEHKTGKGDDVNINVPFANMHIKTDQAADTAGIGLSVYPGAQPVKEHDGDDNDAADIHMSFGSFSLGVKAASFQTGDSPAKVEAFYRNDMKRYGDVIKCQGDETIGQPSRTASGLTCADKDHGGKHHNLQVHGNVNTSDSDEPELRAGSPAHEHIVSIEPKNGGTKIGLVLLDLPNSSDDDTQSE